MAQGNTQTLRTTNTYAMAVTALMTAVTCILAPLSIPIGPVPISLTNLQFIFLSIFWIGRKERSAISFIFFSDLWDFLYFRIHRRNRKACRTNWRIYHWFHPNGNHCRYCN